MLLAESKSAKQEAENGTTGPDRVRIFIENPLQNSNVLHIKMKMPPKVFCMRVSRGTLSMNQLFQLIAHRIHLDCSVWRIVGVSLAVNNAEIDTPALLESNDTVKLHLESAATSLNQYRRQVSPYQPAQVDQLNKIAIESQIQAEILMNRERQLNSCGHVQIEPLVPDDSNLSFVLPAAPTIAIQSSPIHQSSL